MKNDITKEQQMMLEFIRRNMEDLYAEMKDTLKLTGDSPDLGHSLEIGRAHV